MKWQEWLEKWSMTSLKIKTPFLESEWSPKDKDKDASWELYIELLTRIATQPLPQDHGDEKTALESVHKLFCPKQIDHLPLKQILVNRQSKPKLRMM